MPLSQLLSRRVQHILNKNPIALRWVIHENVGYRPHEFSILDDGTATHECVKCRTKLFSIFSDIFLKYVEKTSMGGWNPKTQPKQRKGEQSV